MKELKKKKGYEVIVTSWENDGDNYKTISMQFDTQDESYFVHDLLCKFTTSKAHKFDITNPDYLGNRDINELYTKIFADHVESLYNLHKLPVEYADAGWVDEVIVYELMGGVWCEGERLRVVESVKVVKYLEDVYVEVVIPA